MKKIAALLMCLVMCACALAEELLPGAQMPDFSAACGDEVFTLSEALKENDAVIIYICSDNCDVCRAELPLFADISFPRAAIITLPADTSGVFAGTDCHTLLAADRFGALSLIERGGALTQIRLESIISYYLSPDYTETAVQPDIPYTAEYTISVVDDAGAPVTGVMLNVCTDMFCMPMMVDADGQLIFVSEVYPYEIHVLVCPQGYAFDRSAAFIMEETRLTIVLPRA